MRSRLLVAALIASAAAVSGCLEQETVLMVRPDGSGTLTERTLLTAKTMQMFRNMAAQMAGNGGMAMPDPVDQMIDKQKLAARAKALGEGVTVSSAKKVETEDGRAGAEVVYEVKDVTKLKLGLEQQMSGASGGMGTARVRTAPGSDKQQEQVKLSFVKSVGGRPAKLTVTMPEPKKKPDEAPDGTGGAPEDMNRQVNEQQKMMMKQMCAGMRISLVIRTAGKITKTNATYPAKDGRGVTVYDLNLGKLIQDDKAFVKMEAMGKDTTLAEAKKALNDPLLKKYMQIELKRKIEIEFK